MSIMRCMFSASVLVRTAVYLAMKQLWCVCVCMCVCVETGNRSVVVSGRTRRAHQPASLQTDVHVCVCVCVCVNSRAELLLRTLSKLKTFYYTSCYPQLIT